MRIRDIFYNLLTGFLIGFATCTMIDSGMTEDEDPTLAERRVEAYRLCIQTVKCRMTAEDYVNYYEWKRRLESEDDPTS